ncbi:hypothetical protein Tsubulata_043595 [Turnera subulata]|uniref:DUF7963 domain-containing protein n=1 Tax=Turnera subulata TaxID=218843 RepID=A0A9Q0JF57_9ROSI|nr:hypothetical protein Tsubulata_043595 [Turnera subulata]
MATTTNTSSTPPQGVEQPGGGAGAGAAASTDELTAKAVHKRYEGLVMVRTKAVKGKGAWYWAHLEPMLVHNTDTGLPKAVKLRCSLCDAVFSASNPSRTASEHLKRGTCPNFNSLPKPISTALPSPSSTSGGGGGGNLPNGTSLYRKAVFVGGSVPSKYAEEVLWETITGVCGNLVQQCVGIVADRFKSKALRNLENQNHWMVNLSCQFQGFTSLIKDFGKELELFRTVSENCFKVATFVNNKTPIRNSFHKYQLQEYGHSGLLRVPFRAYEKMDFGPVYTMLEDILSSARALQLVLIDESYKLVAMEDPVAREVAEMIGDVGFWNELEAAHSLVKLIKEMAQEIETERPLIGQCLPLWDELRAKVKDWCSKFHIAEGPVEKVIERRFKKNYHPAWAAAYILDPLYLLRDTSGKYLPPFKCLTADQEKDVDKLITRLVSREEAHIALMELMKWRTEGLDPVYARAVQMKERDPITGKMRLANPQSSRLVWETYLSEFKSLGKVAVRLIFLHATSCGFKCNWSLLRWACLHGHARAGMDKVQKLIFIAAHSKLDRRDFSSDEDKDAELFALANGEDDVLNEVLVDTSSV